MATNSYYQDTGTPASATRGQSSLMRAEFALVQAGFDKLPSPANLGGGAGNFGVDSGAANAYVVTVSSQVTSLFAGLTVRFAASAANTGVSTLNVNGLGAAPIVRPNGAVLAAGDILLGQIVEVAYSAANANWQLPISATGASANFSGTAAGTVDLLYGAAIPSAATVNLSNATGNLVHITGTTTITAVTLTRGPRWVVFDAVLTLTHNASTNNLPGAANIVTAAGDRALYWSDGTSVYCIEYVRANGAPITAGLLHVREEQTSGTTGGTSAAAAFQTRVLNTTKTNTLAGASLSSNQITLPAGTYRIFAKAPAYNVGAHKAKLYNVTDSADVLVGGNSYNLNGSTILTDSIVCGVFSLSAQKVLELRQYTTSAGGSNSLGVPISIAATAEVYSEVIIERIA